MSDLSNVDSDQILSTVNQLDGIVDSIAGSVNKFADAIGALDKGWTSTVKADFMRQYQSDYEAMQEMLSQYREISTQLKEMASDFDKTENEIISSLSALK